MINRYMSLCARPDAVAVIRGSENHPDIKGALRFCRTVKGVLVVAEVSGLPMGENACGLPVLGIHIHEGVACTGNTSDPFADTRAHYNPKKCPHPAHAGDMPPLFVSHGYAFLAFITDRFSLDEIIGKTVIIHSAADDFKTQPSGNSGQKIACGEIKRSGRV